MEMRAEFSSVTARRWVASIAPISERGARRAKGYGVIMRSNFRWVMLAVAVVSCGWARATLISDWTFDGAEGQTTNLPELVGNNVGRAIGDGSISTHDAVVGSGTFTRVAPNGNNDRISIANDSIWLRSSDQFTVAGWIKTNQARYPNIFAQLNVVTAEFRLNDGVLEAHQYRLDHYNQSVLGHVLVDDDRWHFVALTRQLGGTTSLFVDTAFDVENDPSLSAGAEDYYPVTTYLSGNNWNPGFDYSLDGSLDDVSFWYGERLDLAKLRALHNLGISALDYNPVDAQVLFNVYSNGPATVWKDRYWNPLPAGMLHDTPGDVVALPDGRYALILGSGGSGVISTVPGDFNQDNVVDSADYVVWRKGSRTIYYPTDYDVWRAFWPNGR
jgi:concanavalin A-like lectin/glucanase superfamily protein